MAIQDDVRRIASRLPGAFEGTGSRFAMCVKVKGKERGFVWSWAERVHPKKPKVINDGVLAVLVPNLTAKDLFVEADPEKFFTEPHYNGFPAILVRLEAIEPVELESLIVEAWKCRAPKEALSQLER